MDELQKKKKSAKPQNSQQDYEEEGLCNFILTFNTCLYNIEASPSHTGISLPD